MNYTIEEATKLLSDRINQEHYVRFVIQGVVDKAVAAESERCATICDQIGDEKLNPGPKFYSRSPLDCSSIIRNRKK